MPPLPSTSTTPVKEPQKNVQSRKRFHPSALPVVRLDPEGNIVDVTPAARRLLEYDADSDFTPCFFTHVHGKNLYRVMRDVADMVCHGKQSCSWLLRLQTGRGRWRWYKADATNKLDDAPSHIQILLQDISTW